MVIGRDAPDFKMCIRDRIITKEVTNIAETLETQTTEIQQINDGIEQINYVVQTNSATSEECAAASQEMSSEAENLREMMIIS